ncbi:MAG: PilN domain-containing protein, partial [Candidatus Omnitrophica bacterium]|nr:PilN domain-containing protein [Candidatus Omnitrophota bacterium]
KNQMSLTRQLDAIPRIVPEDVWLTGFTFRKEDRIMNLTISGYAALGDSDKELGLVNSFLMQLKENSSFAKYFKDINISSVERSKKEESTATTFVITCNDTRAQNRETRNE